MNLMQTYPHILNCLLVLNYFYVFVSNKFFNFYRNVLNSKTVKVNNSNIFYIQSNPMCTNICIFIKIYYIRPIFYSFREVISRINLIKSRFILIILLYFILLLFVKEWGGIIIFKSKIFKSITSS